MIRHETELIEGKHFLKGETFCPPLPKAMPNQIYLTKRGIVRLGFFIKSERAKLFRDWAEELIIKMDEQRDLFGGVPSPAFKMLPKTRHHNRLTHQRLLSIMGDVCRIEDKEIRLSLTDKLMKGAGV
jgi:hypothetical protein